MSERSTVPNAASRIDLVGVRAALERSGLLIGTVGGALPLEAVDITDDSRLVRRGSIFVAVRGSERDGHDYLGDAASRGAIAALVEDASRPTLPSLVVREGRRAVALAAAAAFGEPARALRLVGVTGTNGKTTTVGIVRHLLDDAKPGAPPRSASIGTLGVLIGSGGREMPGGQGLTTPGPVELQRTLRALVDAGVRSVAMEVSSHSLDQRRVEGLAFDAVVFTNLTRDHLDYHHTFEAYFAAKESLLTYLAPGGTAIVNADDAAWRALAPTPRTLRFAVHAGDADVIARDLRQTAGGSELTLVVRGQTPQRLCLPLLGDFNVANALGAAAAAFALGLPVETIAERLTSVPQVPGRLELVHERPAVLRDYAHTPDALERALTAVRPFARGRLIVVFGAGGDRDRGKRPEMGRIAARLADVSIVTSDNPRTEEPEHIIDDIVAGMNGTPHERIVDRRAAIARALAIAGEDDVIVLAGKGHETYQVRGTTKFPFDERLIVRELMAERPWRN